MDSVILFRKDISTEHEFNIAKTYFHCEELRSKVKEHQLVIARYSALPYYRELELDLRTKESLLINSSLQHSWIANFDYYEDLKDYTFESWLEKDYPYSGYRGPVIVKGRTNSRKHQWSKMMYAPTREDALSIASELANDPLIGPQGLVYRKYTPLKTFEVDPISLLPMTNEWRLFFLGEQLLSYGYYWSIASEEIVNTAKLPEEGLSFAKEIAKIAALHCNFFVLDIAEKVEGGWILVEVNDGQQSGLSCNDPDILYKSLSTAIRSFSS